MHTIAQQRRRQHVACQTASFEASPKKSPHLKHIDAFLAGSHV